MIPILALLLLSSPALAQEPTVEVDAGCVVTCGDDSLTVTRLSVLSDRERYQALLEGTRATEECLPGLQASVEDAQRLEAAWAKQQRLTRRARAQRNALGLVLGGVVLAVVVAVD